MADPDTPLFNYYLATQPQPLQAGDESVQSNGTINVHIAAPSGGNAYTNQIVIAVPVGDGGLFQDSPIFTINTGKWVIASTDRVDGEQIGLMADQPYATCTINCQAQADYGVNYNLVVAMAGAVTAAEGNYQPAVQETSGTTSDPSGFTPKQATFTLSVVPPQFYVSNLTSYATGAPTVPMTEFSAGMDINLEWESNGTWFQVFKKGDKTPFYAGTQMTCTLTGGVTTDTSFFLVASMTGDQSGDTPNFSTVYLYDSITVTITNPVLTPTSVATSGIVSVGSNLTVAGTANVTGQTTLGAATADTLTTTGQATLASALVQGALGVTGPTTMASANVTSGLSVTGGANIAGGLSATANFVSMMSGIVQVQPGSYTAATDGLVIGVVSWPSDSSPYSMCWITGSAPGIWVVATGGNHGAFSSDWTSWRASNGNTFAMPVSRGNGWSVGVQQSGNNEANANTAFYWCPIGANAGTATLTRVSDAQPVLPGGKPHAAHRVSKPKAEYIELLFDIITSMTDKPIPQEKRKALHDVLTKLNSD